MGQKKEIEEVVPRCGKTPSCPCSCVTMDKEIPCRSLASVLSPNRWDSNMELLGVSNEQMCKMLTKMPGICQPFINCKPLVIKVSMVVKLFFISFNTNSNSSCIKTVL